MRKPEIIVRKGEMGYAEFRIPGMVATREGVLLCCEARSKTRDDWSKSDIMLVLPGGEKKFIYGGERETLNNPTFIEDGELTHLVYHSNYNNVYHICSADCGRTWSERAEITAAYREFDYDWNVAATGPCHGVRLSSGRLVLPIWLARGVEHPDRIDHWPSIAGAVYSDDRGATWHAGPLVPGVRDGNETTIAQTPEGKVMFNVRHRGETRRRVIAMTDERLNGFESVGYADELSDPMCCASSVAFDGRLLYLGNASEKSRVMLTLFEFSGGGWKRVETVDEIGGYSDIARFEGHTYAFYERTENGEISELVLARL